MQLLLAGYLRYHVIAVSATLFGLLSLPRPTSGAKAQCMPGHYLNRTSDECDPCPEGTYADLYHRDDRCADCTICSGMRKVAVACNATTDTKCDCPGGYYEHADGCTLIWPEPTLTNENQQSLRRPAAKVDKVSDARYDSENKGATSGEPIIALLSVLTMLQFLVLVVLLVAFRKKLVSLWRNPCRKAASGDQSSTQNDNKKNEVRPSTATQSHNEQAHPGCARPPPPGNVTTRTATDPSIPVYGDGAASVVSEPSIDEGQADITDVHVHSQPSGGRSTGNLSRRTPGAARKAENNIESIKMRDSPPKDDAETSSLLSCG